MRQLGSSSTQGESSTLVTGSCKGVMAAFYSFCGLCSAVARVLCQSLLSANVSVPLSLPVVPDTIYSRTYLLLEGWFYVTISSFFGDRACGREAAADCSMQAEDIWRLRQERDSLRLELRAMAEKARFTALFNETKLSLPLAPAPN